MRGNEYDQRVLNELVQSMPTALLNTVPTDMVTTQSGVAVYAWITRAVMAASDESVGVLQAWFASQPELPAKKKHLLSQSLADWLRVRDDLSDAGAPQSEVQQRLSLESMVGSISEARDVIVAMKAASDTAVPVSVPAQAAGSCREVQLCAAS